MVQPWYARRLRLVREIETNYFRGWGSGLNRGRGSSLFIGRSILCPAFFVGFFPTLKNVAELSADYADGTEATRIEHRRWRMARPAFTILYPPPSVLAPSPSVTSAQSAVKIPFLRHELERAQNEVNTKAERCHRARSAIWRGSPFIALLLTFVISRVCVILIMTRRMPNLFFHAGGTHVHHLNYGIFLLAITAAVLLFAPFPRERRGFWALLYGLGNGPDLR